MLIWKHTLWLLGLKFLGFYYWNALTSPQCDCFKMCSSFGIFMREIISEMHQRAEWFVSATHSSWGDLKLRHEGGQLLGHFCSWKQSQGAQLAALSPWSWWELRALSASALAGCTLVSSSWRLVLPVIFGSLVWPCGVNLISKCQIQQPSFSATLGSKWEWMWKEGCAGCGWQSAALKGWV